jgi:hypothetical protein
LFGWVVAAAVGLALLGGSVRQRFGTFEAGVASTKDPKYVVVPQRERLNAGKRLVVNKDSYEVSAIGRSDCPARMNPNL